jgi:hypothetical protein
MYRFSRNSQLLNGIVWRCKPEFTKIAQEIWKVYTEMHLGPKYLKI